MLGMLAPPLWIVQQIATGVLWGAVRQTGSFLVGNRTGTGIGVVTLLTAVLCVLMVIFCARHWKREFSGLRKFRGTFLGSLGIVILYYAIYWFWFGSLFPWS
jgi:riboflavin transporter FmnP